MPRFRPILLVLVLAACHDSPTGPFSGARPTFHLSATTAWGGEQLRLIASLRLPDTVPAVTVGGQVVPVIRTDDSTLRVTLPTMIGAQPVTVKWGATTLNPGVVTLYGFDQGTTIPGLWGILERLGSGTVVLGNGDSGMVSADVSTGAVSKFPYSMHSSQCDWGPGVTATAGQFVLAVVDTAPFVRPHPDCRFSLWNLSGVATQLPDSVNLVMWSDRTVAQLAPGRWLMSTKYSFNLWVCDTGCVQTNFSNTSGRIDGVHVSPRGDRVAVDDYYSGGSPGVPVFDAATATVAYWLPVLTETEGAAFSPGGDTLFIAGADSAEHAHLLTLRASDGALLDSVTLMEPWGGDVALDPSGKWIFVSGVALASIDWTNLSSKIVTTLEVLDRATGRPVAVGLADTLTAPVVSFWGKQRIVLDAAHQRGYVITTDMFVDPLMGQEWPVSTAALVFRFSFPP